MNGIDQLCPQCGLCCDSTLFADVELRQGDDPRRLARLGLPTEPKTKTKLAAAQPCACFDGKLCQIYADRPARCRLFECGLLKRVQSGALTPAAALQRIARAKSLADKVRTLLRAAGQRDEQRALTHRYAEAMRAPVDFSVPDAADQRGELIMAVSDLMQTLEQDFLR
jgi:Fe-S-cluster containining protein